MQLLLLNRKTNIVPDLNVTKTFTNNVNKLINKINSGNRVT